jgi:DNA relaxase NicK
VTQALEQQIEAEMETLRKKVGNQALRLRPEGNRRSEAIVEAMYSKKILTDRYAQGRASWMNIITTSVAEVFAEDERDLVIDQLVKLSAATRLMLESLDKRRRKAE